MANVFSNPVAGAGPLGVPSLPDHAPANMQSSIWSQGFSPLVNFARSLVGSSTPQTAAPQTSDVPQRIGMRALANLPGPERRALDTIDVNITDPGPVVGDNNPAIASVARRDPTGIAINDAKTFQRDPTQVMGHEAMHLWQNNLPPSIQAGIPLDSPTAPYDIGNVDALRRQGKTLATIPREKAATIVQTYIARPNERKRLQPWIDDMNNIPLSGTMPTAPNAKRLNMRPRPPSPPPQAYK